MTKEQEIQSINQRLAAIEKQAEDEKLSVKAMGLQRPSDTRCRALGFGSATYQPESHETDVSGTEDCVCSATCKGKSHEGGMRCKFIFNEVFLRR